MGLNIKNERVCALAKRVAAQSGQTQTAAIESALERYLEALLADTEESRREQRYRECLAASDRSLARIDAEMTDEIRAAIRADMDALYDDDGLPA
jgi:antitoxin VapB